MGNKQPTLLQQRLFAELQNPDNKTVRQAAIRAGFSPTTPTSAIMARLSETTLADALERRGITPDRMAQRIADGQDAMKLHLDGEGTEHWAPDWGNRHKYDLLVLRVFGVRTVGIALPGENPNIPIQAFKQVFNLMQVSINTQREARSPHAVEVEEDT